MNTLICARGHDRHEWDVDVVMALDCHPFKPMLASGSMEADLTIKLWVKDEDAPQQADSPASSGSDMSIE